MYVKKELDTKKGKFGQVIDRINGMPFIKAFSLCLIAFLIRLIFLDFKYEVSDDYMIDAVLSGAFGTGYDPHLLFSNIILGYILKFFYELIPTVSFYFVFLEFLSFVSVTSVLYVIFCKNKGITGSVMAVLFLSATAGDMFVLVQFTKVATAAGFSGGLLVLYALFETKKRRYLLIASGTVITVFGAFLRFETIYFFACFLVICFMLHAAVFFLEGSGEKKDRIIGILKRFCVCVGLVILLYALAFIGSRISEKDEVYRKNSEFQLLRSGVTDITMPDFEEVQDRYEKIELDNVDFYMIANWNFNDSSVYPEEVLTEVRDIHAEASSNKTNSIGYSVYIIGLRGILTYWPTICLYIACLISLWGGKRRWFPILVLLSLFVLITALIYRGRTMYRVEFSVIFCAIASVMTCFDPDPKIVVPEKRNNKFELISLAVVTVLIFIHIPFSIPRSDYKKLSDEAYREAFNETLLDSGSYLPDKYTFMSGKRRPSGDLIDLMENDGENYYYVDFYTGIQALYFNYKPWIRPKEGLFEKYGYFGSVTMRSPGEKEVLRKNGLDPDDPYLSLVKGNVLSVDNYFPKVKLEYLRKYVDPDVEVELVDEVDGYKIYRYSLPEKIS